MIHLLMICFSFIVDKLSSIASKFDQSIASQALIAFDWKSSSPQNWTAEQLLSWENDK